MKLAEGTAVRPKLSERLELVRILGRVGQGLISERLGSAGRPTSAEEVPGSVEFLSTAWLTDALCRDVAGAQVLGFSVVGGSDGTSSRRALRITYNEAGVAGGLPAEVFAKCSASLESRVLLGITGITMGEATFFNELRPHVELRSPRGHFAAADPTTARSIVLMEDLAARGWTFPDPMDDSVSERDAADMIDQMATYHAAFWRGHGNGDPLDRLPSALEFQQRLNARAGFARRFRRGLERSREVIPAALWRRRDEIWPAVMRSLELNVRGPQTLLHQDVHQGNWLRDPDGRMGLYDWQCVARGGWALDVAYALIAVLAPEDRRSWQRDLVHRYVAALSNHEVPDAPTFEEAWLQVRAQTFHAFAFAVFTNGQNRFQPELQPKDYTLRSIEREAIALDDLASLDAVS